jgi:hypothetical protein
MHNKAMLLKVKCWAKTAHHLPSANCGVRLST